ncbi:hypothetical protein M404DRAFT_1008060 [Pisolithus tinctorius Marx 270]|uniref:Uncharacterized protein n=1 Tax=Pisolithus tinctorius Marx 270 TaxID=870435 RepID=A0A0C3ICI6_PISTI|nr:hypothetical protein M404DRAFT_1008060 [Pisolithus tinctorius Marx 270]
MEHHQNISGKQTYTAIGCTTVASSMRHPANTPQSDLVEAWKTFSKLLPIMRHEEIDQWIDRLKCKSIGFYNPQIL